MDKLTTKEAIDYVKDCFHTNPYLDHLISIAEKACDFEAIYNLDLLLTFKEDVKDLQQYLGVEE